MRFTMLRQDSRLKPLVRRSLSARKTQFQHPSPAGFLGLPEAEAPRGLGSGRHDSRPMACKI